MTNDKDRELIEKMVAEYCEKRGIPPSLAAVEISMKVIARYLAERGKEAVAYVRRHPDGALTAEYIESELIEPVRKNSGAWLPLFLSPPAGTESIIAEKDAEIAQLSEQLAAAQKDAERYRWLKTRPVACPTIGPDLALWEEGSGEALRGSEADVAIDSAIAAQEVKS